MSKSQEEPTPAPPKEQHWDQEERDYYARYLRTQHVLMCVAVGGVVIGIVTLAFIYCTLKVSEKNTEATMAAVRPWLTVSDYVIPDLDKLSTETFKVVVKNVGRTPSTGITVKSWLDYRNRNEGPPKMGVCPVSGGVTYGSMESESPPYPYESPMKQDYSASQIQAVSRHDALLFLHGCLRYGLQGNAFGDTEFCAQLYVLGTNKNLTAPCGSGVTAQIMK